MLAGTGTARGRCRFDVPVSQVRPSERYTIQIGEPGADYHASVDVTENDRAGDEWIFVLEL
jgi:hypothetical protein